MTWNEVNRLGQTSTEVKVFGRSDGLAVSSYEMSEPADQPIPSRGDLLTAEEVAALLRVRPAWVYSETRRHRIPHIRLGRYVRYRRDALVAWMDQLEDQPSTGSARRSNWPQNGSNISPRRR